jgi:phage-related protein
MPDEIQDKFGLSLYMAQIGEKDLNTKPLKGFGSAGVLEIVESYQGGAYRAVYTVKFKDAIYVFHCFQKKSHSGISTPKSEMDLIEKRLKKAESDAKERSHV